MWHNKGKSQAPFYIDFNNQLDGTLEGITKDREMLNSDSAKEAYKAGATPDELKNLFINKRADFSKLISAEAVRAYKAGAEFVDLKNLLTTHGDSNFDRYLKILTSTSALEIYQLGITFTELERSLAKDWNNISFSEEKTEENATKWLTSKEQEARIKNEKIKTSNIETKNILKTRLENLIKKIESNLNIEFISSPLIEKCKKSQTELLQNNITQQIAYQDLLEKINTSLTTDENRFEYELKNALKLKAKRDQDQEKCNTLKNKIQPKIADLKLVIEGKDGLEELIKNSKPYKDLDFSKINTSFKELQEQLTEFEQGINDTNSRDFDNYMVSVKSCRDIFIGKLTSLKDKTEEKLLEFKKDHKITTFLKQIMDKSTVINTIVNHITKLCNPTRSPLLTLKLLEQIKSKTDTQVKKEKALVESEIKSNTI